MPAAPQSRMYLETLAAEAPLAVASYDAGGGHRLVGDVAAEARRLAATVTEAVGPAAARVAVRATNDPSTMAAVQACWSLGATAVLISALTPEAELRRRCAETEVAALLDPAAGTVEALGGAAAGRPDDEAVVIFTSGTSGRPKAASLSHAALRGQLRGMAQASAIAAEGRPLADPPRVPHIVFPPLAHIGGLLPALYGWYLGKPLLLVPKFEARLAVDLVHRFGVVSLGLTPAMVYDLAHLEGDHDLGDVTSVSVGTAPLPDPTRELFEERYGVPILITYGQTEFTGAIAFERYDDVRAGRRPRGSVGRPAPGVDVRIVGEDGRDLPVGEVGEIWARGRGSMNGYLHDRAGRPAGGWLATGDLGRVDAEGFLYVVGRLREMLICGGFKVYPATVERALNALPEVRDSAVAGRPDARLGEIPVAVVVAEEGAAPEEEAIRRALRERLAAYEVPRAVRVVPAIPRTPAGKVDRDAVAGLFATSAGPAG